MTILIASDPRKAASSASSLNVKWWRPWKKTCTPPELTTTRYYPYYFQSWKVTAPKTLGRIAKVLLFTGVNGMNRSVGPATEWPVEQELDISEDEVISPYTSAVEAEYMAQEYIEKFVMRRYRPSQPPHIQRTQFELIYVPYYIYAREGQPLRKAALVEGFTGAIGKVKDVAPVLQAVTTEKAVKH